MTVFELVLWSAVLLGVVTLSIGYAVSWRVMAKAVAEADRRSAEPQPIGPPVSPPPSADFTLQQAP